MSVINKKPFIKSLLESLSDEDLQTLSTLIDGGGNQTPLRRTANAIATSSAPHLSTDDKGVHLCNLTVNYTNFLGYLVYNDDYCVLIWFTDSQVLKCMEIDPSDSSVKRTVNEELNVLELRSVLYETKGGSGGGGGSSDGPKIYHVNDISQVSSDVVEQWKSGDIVTVNNSSSWYVLASGGLTKSLIEFAIGESGDIQQTAYINTCKYKKVNGAWSFDADFGIPNANVGENGFRGAVVRNGALLVGSFEREIYDISNEDFYFLTRGDVIIDGETPQGNWFYDGISEDDEYHYFFKIDIVENTLTKVRYVWDENEGDEGAWVFDTSYGTNGYNTISLGGDSPKVYEVDDVLDISQDTLNSLKPGDIVVEDNYTYQVTMAYERGDIQLISLNMYGSPQEVAVWAVNYVWDDDDDSWRLIDEYGEDGFIERQLANALYHIQIINSYGGETIEDLYITCLWTVNWNPIQSWADFLDKLYSLYSDGAIIQSNFYIEGLGQTIGISNMVEHSGVYRFVKNELSWDGTNITQTTYPVDYPSNSQYFDFTVEEN